MSNRASLRGSVILDPNTQGYVLYDQTPTGHYQHHRRTPSRHIDQIRASEETNLDDEDDEGLIIGEPIYNETHPPSLSHHSLDHNNTNAAPIYAGRPSMNNLYGSGQIPQNNNNFVVEDQYSSLIGADELLDPLSMSTSDSMMIMSSKKGGAEEQSALLCNHGDNDHHEHYREMGIYGWRKKVIYVLVAVIVLLVGLNAALTYWIVTFLNLSSHGIAGLDLTTNGPDRILFKGNASFERLLFASEVASYPLQSKGAPAQASSSLQFGARNGDITFRSSWSPSPPPAPHLKPQVPKQQQQQRPLPSLNNSTIITDETTNNSTVKVGEENEVPIDVEEPEEVEANSTKKVERNIQTNKPKSESKLTLTKGKVLLETSRFEVYDSRTGRMSFGIGHDDENEEEVSTSSNSSTNNKFTLRVDHLHIDAINSLTLPRALQTPVIHTSGATGQLDVLSPGGRIRVMGTKAVSIESRFGDTSLTTAGQLALKSHQGRITLESWSGIYFRDLKEVKLPPLGEPKRNLSIIEKLQKPKVFQLCICGNSGKVFVVPPERRCEIDHQRDCV